MSYPVIYSLDDLNFIANNLAEEIGGDWDRFSEGVALLTTTDGYVTYRYDDGYWWVLSLGSSTERHERLIAGFLRSIGVDAAPAQRVAEAVVAKRQADGSSCQGPGYLELRTYRNDADNWQTYFTPVLSRFYDKYPAC